MFSLVCDWFIFAIIGFSGGASGRFFGSFFGKCSVNFSRDISMKNPPNPLLKGPSRPINFFKGANEPPNLNLPPFVHPFFLLGGSLWNHCLILYGGYLSNPANGFKNNFLEVVFLHFEVWVVESKVFDVKFHFSMSKSPWGQVLSRFHWIGDGFIRGRFFKKTIFC